MIVDSSALLAILRSEPDAELYATALESAPRVRLSAASYLETSLVVDGSRDPVASAMLDRLLDSVNAELVAFTPAQARVARAAHHAFGRGSGHPARLNFGDCFSYALAKTHDEPLLFKGNDFGHTDIEPAL